MDRKAVHTPRRHWNVVGQRVRMSELKLCYTEHPVPHNQPPSLHLAPPGRRLSISALVHCSRDIRISIGTCSHTKRTHMFSGAEYNKLKVGWLPWRSLLLKLFYSIYIVKYRMVWWSEKLARMLNCFLLYPRLKLFSFVPRFLFRMLVTSHNCVLKHEKEGFRCEPFTAFTYMLGNMILSCVAFVYCICLTLWSYYSLSKNS